MKKILLVENNPDILQIMKNVFSSGTEWNDYESFSAETGVAAIKLLNSNIFDLIIAAEDLPDIEGQEIAEWVGYNAIHNYTPFILLISDKSLKLFPQLSRIGVITSFLTKPINKLQINVVSMLAINLKRRA